MKNNNRPIYVLIVLMLIWLLILSLTGNRTRPSETTTVNEYEVSGFSTDLTKTVEDAKDSIVTITTDQNVLSGFVYTQKGDTVYVLTCYHGVADAAGITVSFGRSYSVNAALAGYDIFTDLAVLSFTSPYNIRPLKMGDATLVKAGEFLITIGTPVSAEHAGSVQLGMAASGIQSIANAINVEEQRHEYYLDVLQVSGVMASGYSGSPLLNMNGEVVGMNTMSLSANFNYALTANEIKIVADRLIEDGAVDKLSLGVKGIYVKDLANYEKNNLSIDIEMISGLLVLRVDEDSACYKAGIRNGDIIMSIDERQLNDLNDLLEICYGPSQAHVLSVMRGSEELRFSLEDD